MSRLITPPHLLMGDLHFGSTTLTDLKPSLEWVLEQQKQHEPMHVFVLGDTINSSKKIDPEAYQAAIQFFGRLAKRNGQTMMIDLHILIGNHDMIHPSTMDHHAFSWLEEIGDPHIHIYSQIELLPFLNVLMVPYFQDQSVFMDWVDTHLTLEQSSKLVLYGHFHLDDAIATGFSTYHARSTTTGSSTKRTLTSAWLAARFKRVITSHFHTHQILSQTVEYTSSLIETRAGEGGDHGCVLYYPDTDKSVFLQNPLARRFWDVDYKDLLSGMAKQTNANHDDLVRNYQDHQLVCVRYKYDTPKRKLQEAIAYVKQNLGITKVKTYMRSPMTDIVSQMKFPLDQTGDDDDAKQQQQQQHTAVAPITLNLDEEIVNFVNDGQTERFWKSCSEDVLSQHVIECMQAFSDGDQGKRTVPLSTKLLDLNFHNITMTNFCSIPGTTTFELGDKTGVYVLEGNNGSGKSLVIEAIVWCFFDTTIRDMIKPKVAHVMKQPVSVSIKLSNGFIIHRERLDTHASKMAYNRFSVTNHQHQVICTDKDIFTREFLGVQTSQQFLNSMMLTTQKSRGFLHAKASVRQEMLETMMGLDFLKSYQVQIDEYLNDFDAKMEAYDRYKLDVEVMDGARKRCTDLEKEYELLKEQENKNRETTTITNEEEEETVSTLLYNEHLASLTLAKEVVQSEWQNKVNLCSQEVETCKVDMAGLMRDKQHINHLIVTTKNEMENIHNLLNNDEHTAIKKLLSDFITSEAYQQIASHELLQPVHQFLTVSLPTFLEGEHQNHLTDLTQTLCQYEQQQQNQSNALQSLQSRLLELTTRLKKLKLEQQAAVKQADTLIQLCRSEQETKERASILKREQQKSLQQIVILTQKRLGDAQASLERLLKAKPMKIAVEQPTESTIKKANIYRFWKDMLGTPTNNEPHRGAFRRYLRQTIIHNINQHLNHTIQELNHGEANRALKLTLTNDLLLRITDPQNNNNNNEDDDNEDDNNNNKNYLLTQKSTQKESLAERNTLSFGESFKLELAIFFIIFQSLSFSSKQSKPNILFLDESLMGLDDQTVIQLIQYLRFSLLERTKTLTHIVILHAGSLPVMAQTYLQGVIKCHPYISPDVGTNTTSQPVPSKSRANKPVIKRTKIEGVGPISVVEKWDKYSVIHYQ